MPFPELDRRRIRLKPLRERKNKVRIERDHVPPTAEPRRLTEQARAVLRETAARLVSAREVGRTRMIAFGAHTIKNGLAPVLIKLIEDGWLTHLATNGAGIIHDWEFAFQGESSEDVRAGVGRGEFGVWDETGFYINLAILVGAYQGLGYGESVGVMVEKEGLQVPSEATLKYTVDGTLGRGDGQAAAAADLLDVVRAFQLDPGWMRVAHPYKQYGLQAAAHRLKVPYTGHPMIGHDIIYIHPMNHCAAIGRAAQRDFLCFANNVTNLDGGVYLSLGSAVMSPMIFEKSLSMAQNLAIQDGRHIDNHFMMIADLAESHWDWQQGEPPENHPDYYLRYNKSFARMGGTMRYVTADNRDFLLSLARMLEQA